MGSSLPVRRVDRQVQLAGSVDPAEAIARLRAAAAKIPNVSAEQPPEVDIVDLNLVGPVLAVRPYTHNNHYWQVYFDTNAMTLQICKEAGWPAPTPTQINRMVQA